MSWASLRKINLEYMQLFRNWDLYRDRNIVVGDKLAKQG